MVRHVAAVVTVVSFTNSPHLAPLFPFLFCFSSNHPLDVLMGRGGRNNQFCGNERLRDMARNRCRDYQHATKKGKSQISRELVDAVRLANPAGR